MTSQLDNATKNQLAALASRLVASGKGLLAADESTSTIGKRLEKAGLQNVEEVRQAYRELYMTTKGVGQYISGVIMFKETLYQKTKDGKPFVACMRDEGIEPGIKVDEGLQPLPGGLDGETYTKGLDNLAAAVKEYKAAGATFTKWRATIKVQAGGPSQLAVTRNAEDLASYASIVQAAGLVPVVEPEILIDGSHDAARFQEVTEHVFAETVSQLWRKGVFLEGVLLKPQMVIPGSECPLGKASAEEIGERTVVALRRTLPSAVPGVVFLSGGQTEEEATLNLNAVNLAARRSGRCPWALSFSFGRGLQHSALQLWAADRSKVPQAQAVFAAMAKVNSQAAQGAYDPKGPHPSLCSSDTLHETFRGWQQP